MAISKERVERGYTSGNSVDLLRSGEPFFAAMELAIDSAVDYIHFQTYMVAEDDTGDRIVNALIQLLIEGLGCIWFSMPLVRIVLRGVPFQK